jgi:hypothetical protein
MNANRVPGLGPSDANKPIDRQAQREAAQRVEKVGEVDPDEQARQQRFKQIMQSNAEEDVAESPPLPSPFDLSSANQSSSDFGLDEIPSSSYSQPPSVSSVSNDSQDSMSGEDLPQSEQFWKTRDLPDQPIGKPKFQETSTKKSVPSSKKEGQELSILGPPGKGTGKTSDQKASNAQRPKKTPGEETPQARYWAPDHEASSTHAKTSSAEGKKGPREKSLSLSEEDSTSEEFSPAKGSLKTPAEFGSHLSRAQREQAEKQKKEREQKKKESVQIIAPSLPELPMNIQPGAIAATQAAASYLRPEAVPIFYQMIGSIMIMSAPPGISRTEFVLNNPALANSKFFGATVELIKYSTAPDSYNIRLSGSNEAVAAFNQNLPGLMAAFQTGHYSFRIGRIDAEYSTDRPVLRRKDGTEGGSGKESKQDKRH